MTHLRFSVLLLVALVFVTLPGGDTEIAAPSVRTVGVGPGGPLQVLRVMPLGASSTEGIGSPATAGYRGPLLAALDRDGVAIDYVGSLRSGPAGLRDRDNEGHSGWTLERMTPVVAGWVRKAEPDVILLHMGTNDIGSGASGAVVADRLDRFLDEIDSASPATHVIVAGVWAKFPNRASARAELARLTPGVVAKHTARGQSVRYVDNTNLLDARDFTDSLHANARGYGKIAAMWATEIEGWLAQEKAASSAAERS
ncbi:MAG: SGNH/GDSL hydrolase family protein [Pseudonocardia sp.]|nr:SGNH/GDSL hydrolase family protein [Pseudonocardia sp.]